MLCLVAAKYSATSYNWFSSLVCLMYSEILVEMWWPIWAAYILPREHGILQTPDFWVGSCLSFVDLNLKAILLSGFCMVWMLCFSVAWRCDQLSLGYMVSKLCGLSCLSQFTWSQKLLLPPLLLTMWPLKTSFMTSFQPRAHYRLDSSPFLCSANKILHTPFATYCLLYIRLPKTPITHSPWRWNYNVCWNVGKISTFRMAHPWKMKV
jgi:hypothetical protein